MRLLTLTGAALAVLLSGSTSAGGHAFLDRADPPVGGTVRTSPAEVRIWFTEGLEPAFSGIEVVDRTGQRVDKRDSRIDLSNPALLKVSLPSLAPGTYKVIWRVLSVDTHVTEGDFVFAVAP